MFLFIWHIIPLGQEIVLLWAATNDHLDLWCSNLRVTNHVGSPALKDFGTWNSQAEKAGTVALIWLYHYCAILHKLFLPPGLSRSSKSPEENFSSSPLQRY
jgi:hypothetical protein